MFQNNREKNTGESHLDLRGKVEERCVTIPERLAKGVIQDCSETSGKMDYPKVKGHSQASLSSHLNAATYGAEIKKGATQETPYSVKSMLVKKKGGPQNQRAAGETGATFRESRGLKGYMGAAPG